jgi:hypothetical protein
MNKFITLFAGGFFCFSWISGAEELLSTSDFIQSTIDLSNQVVWLTRSTSKVPQEFILIDNIRKQECDKIKCRLSNLKIDCNVDTTPMDEPRKDDGYLIFKKDRVVTCVLKVEPFSTNKNSFRYCRWILNADNIIVIYQVGGMLDGLASDQEYRSLISEFNVPKLPRKDQLFKVYVADAWSTRFEHERK